MNPIKVLACDDNLEILELYKLMLPAPAFQVFSIHDTEIFFDSVETFKPDRILLDLHMPGMPPAAILKRLKKDPNKCNIPVIVCSADMRGEASAKENGADFFLMKPFDLEDFRLVIRGRE